MKHAGYDEVPQNKVSTPGAKRSYEAGEEEELREGERRGEERRSSPASRTPKAPNVREFSILFRVVSAEAVNNEKQIQRCELEETMREPKRTMGAIRRVSSIKYDAPEGEPPSVRVYGGTKLFVSNCD